jgi:hypothetical protein
MEQCMMANGTGINSTVMGSKHGLMGQNMKATIKMAENADMVVFNGLMDQNIKANFKITF